MCDVTHQLWNMKFEVKNLGVVKQGEFTQKPLTIFCGPNNSGKTWVMYSLYYFHKGTSKNWAKPSSELPSHHEKVSPGAGFVWTSQLCQGGGRQFFEVPIK